MPDDLVPLDYQCPVCGEKAVAGSHFCRQNKPKPLKFAPAPPSAGRGGMVRLVGLVVTAVLLWSWVGPWSLLGVGFGATLLLLWENRRR